MANPAPDPTLRTSSTGRRATTENATAPLEVSTPIKFTGAGPDYGDPGPKAVGIDDRRHSIRRVMKAVHEFEAQCHEKGQYQE